MTQVMTIFSRKSWEPLVAFSVYTDVNNKITVTKINELFFSSVFSECDAHISTTTAILTYS